MHVHAARLAGILSVVIIALPPPAQASAKQRPSNEWSRVELPAPGPAQAIGGVARGCLVGAKELPPDGAGYAAIRLSRHRNFGHPELVDFIERLGRGGAGARLPVFYVGDMAQPRGGPLPYGHASHQTGIDVDIWFVLQSHPRPAPAAREALDLPSMLLADDREIDPRRFGRGQVTLLRLAASDPAVDRIFVNPVIKQALCRGIARAGSGERPWLARIRPWYGHDEHFHVRLKCPAGSADCEAQKPAPEGDGCGAELAWWMRHLPPQPPEAAPGPRPGLPSACRGVLTAP
jgi:penicillin-insensitive murein DD-endopeptidase